MSLGALIEPLSCAVHGYDLIRTRLGDRVIIYGAGTMGLLLLLLAWRTGALSVTMVEPNEARRAKAVEMGASESLASTDELDGDRRFDVVIDATGIIGRSRTGSVGCDLAAHSCNSACHRTLPRRRSHRSRCTTKRSR